MAIEIISIYSQPVEYKRMAEANRLENFQGAEHTFVYRNLQSKIPKIKFRYRLPMSTISALLSLKDPLEDDPFRMSVYLNTYARKTYEALPAERTKTERLISYLDLNEYQVTRIKRKETWIDTVIRCIEGLMTFYIAHFQRHVLGLDLDLIDVEAHSMTMTMFRMQWSPPGRGLYIMGTEYCYRCGVAALNNCYGVDIRDGFVKPMTALFSLGMRGGGVGLRIGWKGRVIKPNKHDNFTFVVPDSREGWEAAFELLLRAYVPLENKSKQLEITNKFPVFDYSQVRPKGAPIHGFGGIASGPEPLRILLTQVEAYFDAFLNQESGMSQLDVYKKMFLTLHSKQAYSLGAYNKHEVLRSIEHACNNYDNPFNHTILQANIANAAGYAVACGNIRRAAQLIMDSVANKSFLNLKKYEINPTRTIIMRLSNNTAILDDPDEFAKNLPSMAESIIENGEPGIDNAINTRKYGCHGCTKYGPDKAIIKNPCGETPLENYECCCLSNWVATHCMNADNTVNYQELEVAIKHATFWATTVVAIPHDWPEVNKITAKNRRIGVGMSAVYDLKHLVGVAEMIEVMKFGYKKVRYYNKKFSNRQGTKISNRVTVIKPDGTTGILLGCSQGVHPNLCRGIRRVTFDGESPIFDALVEAGYQYEIDKDNPSVKYIHYPILPNGKISEEISIHEKLMIAEAAQRHYADNSVSFTGNFSKAEAASLTDIIEANISKFKSMAFLMEKPCNEYLGVYDYLPNENRSREEVEAYKASLKTVDWSRYFAAQVEDPNRDAVSFCSREGCS